MYCNLISNIKCKIKSNIFYYYLLLDQHYTYLVNDNNRISNIIFFVISIIYNPLKPKSINLTLQL